MSEVLPAQNLPDLAGGADGQQQGPGEQGVGVQQAALGVGRRAGAVAPRVRAHKQALEALHGVVHVLREKVHTNYKRLSKYRSIFETHIN